MRPQFLVLCEGETEEAYINFLKQRYRLPIKIVPKIIGSNISQRLINQYKKELSTNPAYATRGDVLGSVAELTANMGVYVYYLFSNATVNGNLVFNNTDILPGEVPYDVTVKLDHYYDIPSDAEAGHWEIYSVWTDNIYDILHCNKMSFDLE